MKTPLFFKHSCVATLRWRVESWRNIVETWDADPILQAAYQQKETMRVRAEAAERRALRLETMLTRVLKEIEDPWLRTADDKKANLANLSVRLHSISRRAYAVLDEEWPWLKKPSSSTAT